MTNDERFRVTVPYLLLGVFGFAVTLFTLLGMFTPALFVALLCGVVGAIGFAVYAQGLRLEIRLRAIGGARASVSQRVERSDLVAVPVDAEIADEVKEGIAEGWRIRKLEKPREL